MLASVLIWRIWGVEKIVKLKLHNHFQFHCETYNFMKISLF
jgi:hypothetical protein